VTARANGSTATAEPVRLEGLPRGARTRFAPAPTGLLHLGHVANAIWTWGVARAIGGPVLLRIEDHDRQRSRPEYDTALVEDLAWLGFRPDEGTVRQSDPDAQAAYRTAGDRLDRDGRVYGCSCTRTTFSGWAAEHGRPWSGPGCPGACRSRALDGPVLRASLGDGIEGWSDRAVGPRSGPVAPRGDLPIRDRNGNWTYGFCVVVDDWRQDIDLVIRGQDLLDSTPAQIRLGRLLGRVDAPVFAHHPLIRRSDGRKLSKSDGDTGVRDLRSAGLSPADVIALAGRLVGVPDV
jgi:glutamyl-Q tRNA(Asp) synthetase